MGRWIFALSVFFGAIAGITGFLDIWLPKIERNKIADKLSALWIRLDDSDFSFFSRIPLQLLEYTYDILLGSKAFSAKSFFRIGCLSVLLLLASLALNGLRTNEPFGFNKTPNQMYLLQQEYAGTLSSMYTKLENTGKDGVDKALSHQMVTNLSIFKTLSSKYKGAQIALFFISLLIVSVCMYSISFSMGRLLLREIIDSDSIVLKLAVLCLTLVISMCLGALTIAMLLIAYFPVILAIAIPIYSLSVIVGVFLSLPVILGLWTLGWTWLQITASLVLMPTTLLSIALILSILLYPIRKQLHKTAGLVLLRALQGEAGVLLFISTLLGLLATLTGYLAHFLS
jgi:hypothetical protein